MKRLLLALVLLPSLAFAAGSSVTWTTTIANPTGRAPLVKKHQAVVVSDDSAGTASGTLTMSGKLVQFVAVPDGGDTAPAADYDCTLKDPDGADIVTGLLADCSATATTVEVPLVGTLPYPFRIYGTATLACENMGNSNGTTLTFYVEE